MRKDESLSKLIGKRVRIKRNDLGLTQLQLSQMVDCDQKYIQSIEHGRSRPSLELILKISEVFNESAEYFIQGSYKNEKYEDAQMNESIKRLSPYNKKIIDMMIKNLLELQSIK